MAAKKKRVWRPTATVAAATLAVGVALGALAGLLFGPEVVGPGAEPAAASAPQAATSAPGGRSNADASALMGEPVRILRPQERPLPVLPAPMLPAGPEPAWRRFAAPPPETGGRPMVAIALDDLGVDQEATRDAAALSGPYTLSYLPYGRHLGAHVAAARAAGHEVLVHVPMQPEGRVADPGPDALLLGLGEAELLRRLRAGIDAVVGEAGGAVGINNHMGSLFTADPAGMATVMRELRARGMMFLDSRTTAASVGVAAALAEGVPAVERDVFLDHVDSPGTIHHELARLEDIARREGTAIAIGHPRPHTLTALREWQVGLKERGIALVPLTAVLERRRQVAGRG
ncbi:MAG: divergent polysaccharide deacetylase family protein [Acetobacterales bacterium]